MRTFSLALLFALAGCAPHVRYIPTPCLTKDQALPAEPPKIHDKLTGKADEDLRIVAGSVVRLRAYASGLRLILEGCRER
jgi:hypothetical protein